MSDLEHVAIERLKIASEMSLQHYGLPLVVTDSGGKDSQRNYTQLCLVGMSGVTTIVKTKAMMDAISASRNGLNSQLI